ncbi:MAG: ribonuclease J [Parvularculaceae bacterium]|nr:ribonuclease J [Parvularculaceae bacterium]
MAKDEFVFLPLGGAGEIGMNLNLYGFGPPDSRKWIMVDCGVMFGDLSTPGIDLVTPDHTFIAEEKENLLAIVLTHGHEDHIGAIALLGPDFNCPVYATPFTAKLVENKLDERGVELDLRVIDMDARLEIGPFDVEFVTLTHSIPEPNGLLIRTALGRVLHTGDWKIDPEPTLGPKTDSHKLKSFGDEGVLAMVCDSTNVLSAGESGSETRVKEHLTKLIAEQTGRVAVTTFASNVSRVVAVCEAAKAADRSVCLLGRSMLRLVDAARAVGLLPADVSFVDPKEAGFLPKEHVLFLCTGSQGEPRAALSRIARDDHPDLSLGEGDTVIFSSKIIPGNERNIFSLLNDLVELGVDVITEKDAFVHVSGHPNRDELEQMYKWVRPIYAIPVHGEARHLEAHADFALSLGVADAISPRNGDLIRLAPGEPQIIDETPAGRLFLDGNILVADGASPMRERRKLSYAGMVTVAVALDERGELACEPAVAIFGAPRETAADGDLSIRLAEVVEAALTRLAHRKRFEDDAVELALMRAVRNAMMAAWGKRANVKILLQRV